MIKVRKGQAPPPHSRVEFGTRFRSAYFDPAFSRAPTVVGPVDSRRLVIWSAGAICSER
jgi:hypothetical protein